jgi:hypothetical protein
MMFMPGMPLACSARYRTSKESFFENFLIIYCWAKLNHRTLLSTPPPIWKRWSTLHGQARAYGRACAIF